MDFVILYNRKFKSIRLSLKIKRSLPETRVEIHIVYEYVEI